MIGPLWTNQHGRERGRQERGELSYPLPNGWNPIFRGVPLQPLAGNYYKAPSDPLQPSSAILSLPQAVSLPLLSFLSLSLVFLSLNVSHGPRPISALRSSNHDTCCLRSLKRHRCLGMAASPPSGHHQRRWWWSMKIAEEKWPWSIVSSHNWWWLKVPAGSFRPHDRNGGLRSWWKWPDCQTHFSRQIIKF